MAEGRKLRYATPDDAPDEPVAARARPRYHGSVTRPGATSPWGDSPDNPLSPNFVPLTNRTERGKARWWALKAKNSGRPTHGVFDP